MISIKTNFWYFIFLGALIAMFVLVAVFWSDGLIFAFIGLVTGLCILFILRLRRFLIHGD